jgi:ubiquinone/menaquinone biosynthesis C-methylase UbiE
MATISIASAINVGTGTGRHALHIARRGIAVIAIDASPEMLAVAQDKAWHAGFTVHFQRAAIADGLPGATNQFDLLICALTLCRVADLHQAHQEYACAVRPGGSVLITDIHPNVVALGWKAMLRYPGMTYVLPCASHTRAAYLDAVTMAGLTIRTVIEVPVRAIPAGLIIEAVREESGDKWYCLLVLADKPIES